MDQRLNIFSGVNSMIVYCFEGMEVKEFIFKSLLRSVFKLHGGDEAIVKL